MIMDIHNWIMDIHNCIHNWIADICHNVETMLNCDFVST